jgi:hypothetical protein
VNETREKKLQLNEREEDWVCVHQIGTKQWFLGFGLAVVSETCSASLYLYELNNI